MSLNWGPHFIVPSETLRAFSGKVLLRENFDETLLKKELEKLGYSGAFFRATNPWYYRKKDGETWIKIGESSDRQNDFSVQWDTTALANGAYQVLGLMHVFVKKADEEFAVARQNIVEVTIEN
ncbi:MAG: hypothetical protein A2Y65_10580 [Deltaproteobacteria bacterium RBG_13_52_11]|nr:MAG: hypothetical protein A2Y65_10580 [Deltaproteobacteria bacterium RBG_13_52_11]